MATSSKSQGKPVRGILKTSRTSDHSDIKAKKRKLPPWMTQKETKLITNSSLPALQIPPSCEIIYSNNENDCAMLCDDFLTNVEQTEHPIIGLDIEWPVSYIPGNVDKTAVIQICDNPKERCFVFHVSCMSRLPGPLRAIIESSNIVKVGLNIEGDMQKLRKDFDLTYPQHGVEDLGILTNKIRNCSENWSLSRLVNYLLSCDLPKSPSIRKSQWDRKEAARFDEMNILATYHPADKDYGHMKIDEPKTPYRSDGGEDPESIDPDDLAKRLTTADQRKGNRTRTVSTDEEEEEHLTPAAREKKHKFEEARKKHYNMKEEIRKAKELLAKEMAEEDD